MFVRARSEHGTAPQAQPLHGLALATWLVFWLIVDLDPPRRGWIQVSQEPLVRLHQSLLPTER